MGKTIVVAGSLAQRPGHGGHTWVFLQYLLGFRRLGWDVLFLDRLEPDMCLDAGGNPCPLEDSENLRYFREVLARFGLAESFALLCDKGRTSRGLSRRELLERVRRSALLLNVMGFLDDEEVLAAAPCKAFLDIDPGFGQMWQALGLHSLFRGHDHYVTIGENIGRPGCEVPDLGLPWVTTPQPVVLEHWKPGEETPGGPYSSVASWRGPFGPIEYQGKTYGLRVHEFRKLAALPGRCGRPFALALDIHPGEVKDLELLRANGWTLVDPREAAGDPWKYQRFLRSSRAEVMVAKNLYVQTRGGWFSDRSQCYLACGKPVLAQDTGFGQNYPTGAGLLSYRDLGEAAAGVEAIDRDYRRHARAAHDLAREYFDSDRVLGRLLDKLAIRL